MRLVRRVCLFLGSVHEGLRGPSEASTLIVPVQSAVRVVEVGNEGLTTTSLAEIPPHVTVLCPFVPPSRLEDRFIAQLGGIFGAIRPFAFSLDEVGHFPGVTWLRPAPASGFVELTEAVTRAFPSFPPYGGAFDCTIHHLTLVMRDCMAASVADAVATMLPVTSTAEEVWLMCRPARGRWAVRERFALGVGVSAGTPQSGDPE